MIRRRDFVLGCGSLAVISGMPIAGAATLFAGPGHRRADRFRPFIDTVFAASNEAGQTLGMKLVAIEETRIDRRLEQFRLVFESDERNAEDAIFSLSHRDDPNFVTETVNIEKSASDPSGRTYVARFCLFAA